MKSEAKHIWEGVKAIAINARTLLDSSRDAAEKSRYGLASSLAVLSAEESAKALSLIAWSVGFADKMPPMKRFFRDHRTKHEAGMLFFNLSKLMEFLGHLFRLKKVKPLFGHPDYVAELEGAIKSNSSDKPAEAADRILKKYQAWIDSADMSKQNGLYVDNLGDRWHSPASTSKSEYLLHMEIASELVEALEFIVLHVSPSNFATIAAFFSREGG